MKHQIADDAELSVVVEQLKAAELIIETETDPAPVSLSLLDRLHKHLLAVWRGEVTS